MNPIKPPSINQLIALVVAGLLTAFVIGFACGKLIR